ncbi:MAG: site-2 protease family protein [Candidatus Hydrogenedens sp.]|nr:site-2 protease family protein [Candidatus Hydrogenedens sp.]
MFQNLDFGQIALQYFCLLFSLCVHEAAHALMADLRGDSTARFLGRVTLDPRKHIDPIGTVLLPLLAMSTGIPFLFGWAKPVPFNFRNLKDRRLDPVWIALAGPGSNIVIGTFSLFVMKVLVLLYTGGLMNEQLFGILAMVFLYLAGINFVLALFNVIPVPPLDGHYVLKYFLPPQAEAAFERIGPFGIIIAIMVARPWLNFAMQPFHAVLERYILNGLI